MTKLLVPIDNSELSKKAVHFATSLAAAEGDTSLTLLHVLQPLPPGKTINFIDPSQFRHYQMEDAIEQLKPTIEIVENANIEHSMHYEVGIPHETIAHWAEKEQDYIVMGTHGYGRLTGWMMGSVGYPLIPHLPIPAILVPEDAAVYRAPKKILIAVDSSDYARAAAEAAIALGKKVGAEYILFSAVGYSHPYAEEMDASLHEKLMQSGEEILASFEDMMKSHGVTYTSQVAIGDPASHIKQAAEDADCDLIAMGFHGASGITEFLMGSVVFKVIHRTNTPLLIVKS